MGTPVTGKPAGSSRAVASILAVGTELTTGQVTNRNAAWVSEQLVNLGYSVREHLTVADDRARILSALERCATGCDTVFVTGGLGPTTDDFTREVVAEWLGRPLQFDEASWKHIEERLTRFGVNVAPSNRQQCYFPEGARIVTNPHGTANAFIVSPRAPFPTSGDPWVYVLPGPPREVEAVWRSGIEDDLRKRLPEGRGLELLTWQCMGKSEAEIGEITERALEGSGLPIGYRAHRPFIEVKVWVPQSRAHEKPAWSARVEEALAPWIATRQGEDLAQSLLAGIEGSEEAEFWDLSTSGILAERIGLSLRRLPPERRPDVRIFSEIKPQEEPPEAEVRALLSVSDCAGPSFALAGPDGSGTWAIGWRDETGRVRIASESAPWKRSAEALDRIQRHLAERALLLWRNWVRDRSH